MNEKTNNSKNIDFDTGGCVKTNKELQDHIVSIEKTHTETIRGLILNHEKSLKEIRVKYENKLAECDLQLDNAVQKEITKLKNSWTWRIGRVQIISLLLAKNLILNPILFFLKKQYRWKDIYYFDELRFRLKTKTNLGDKVTLKAGDSKRNKDQSDPDKLTILCVFDAFTKNCFAPEFNLFSPTPDNWRMFMDSQKMDAVFMESAWHGNDNSWELLTHNLSGIHKLEIVTELITTAKKKGIKTIFWNKEDPVHFNAFIDTAKLFDFIFTSDTESIQKYHQCLNHSRIYFLPFAAQHKIHNPVRENSKRDKRDKTVCFAGTYYNFSYAERKIDLDFLLKPAIPYGLEIYDRNYGETGATADKYRFPEIYQPVIKGKLDYAEMVNNYKKYKVFLNVNSVKYSSTMFARRVFELLACGTPVISNYSKGIINLLGEETVFIAENENDTRKFLDRLLGDEHFWWRQSLMGMRKVIESHTYQVRASEICSVTGLPFRKPDPVSFLILSEVGSMKDAVFLAQIINAQTYQRYRVLLIVPSGSLLKEFSLEDLYKCFSFTKVTILIKEEEKETVNALTQLDFSHLAWLNARHYYGKNFLRDYALAATYSGAKIMGKKESVSYSRSGNLIHPPGDFEYRFVDGVPSDTLVIEKSQLDGLDFLSRVRKKDFILQDRLIFSVDPYNFLEDGQNAFLGSPENIQESIGI